MKNKIIIVAATIIFAALTINLQANAFLNGEITGIEAIDNTIIQIIAPTPERTNPKLPCSHAGRGGCFGTCDTVRSDGMPATGTCQTEIAPGGIINCICQYDLEGCYELPPPTNIDGTKDSKKLDAKRDCCLNANCKYYNEERNECFDCIGNVECNNNFSCATKCCAYDEVRQKNICSDNSKCKSASESGPIPILTPEIEELPPMEPLPMPNNLEIPFFEKL